MIVGTLQQFLQLKKKPNSEAPPYIRSSDVLLLQNMGKYDANGNDNNVGKSLGTLE